MIHLDPDPEQVVEIQIQSVDLGQAVPRTKYPLVLVAKADHDEAVTIYIVHIEDKPLMSFPTHFIGTYLKQDDNKVTHLVPIYQDSDQCVVCLSRPPTRVILPCRHANLCSQCYVRLPNGNCPMCRTQIQSYFLTNNEDDGADHEANEQNEESPTLTWRQRLAQLEHRFAIAAGLQEND